MLVRSRAIYHQYHLERILIISATEEITKYAGCGDRYFREHACEAKLAHYQDASLDRGLSETRKRSYFKKVADGWTVSDEIK